MSRRESSGPSALSLALLAGGAYLAYMLLSPSKAGASGASGGGPAGGTGGLVIPPGGGGAGYVYNPATGKYEPVSTGNAILRYLTGQAPTVATPGQPTAVGIIGATAAVASPLASLISKLFPSASTQPAPTAAAAARRATSTPSGGSTDVVGYAQKAQSLVTKAGQTFGGDQTAGGVEYGGDMPASEAALYDQPTGYGGEMPASEQALNVEPGESVYAQGTPITPEPTADMQTLDANLLTDQGSMFDPATVAPADTYGENVFDTGLASFDTPSPSPAFDVADSLSGAWDEGATQLADTASAFDFADVAGGAWEGGAESVGEVASALPSFW